MADLLVLSHSFMPIFSITPFLIMVSRNRSAQHFTTENLFHLPGEDFGTIYNACKTNMNLKAKYQRQSNTTHQHQQNKYLILLGIRVGEVGSKNGAISSQHLLTSERKQRPRPGSYVTGQWSANVPPSQWSSATLHSTHTAGT